MLAAIPRPKEYVLTLGRSYTFIFTKASKRYFNGLGWMWFVMRKQCALNIVLFMTHAYIANVNKLNAINEYAENRYTSLYLCFDNVIYLWCKVKPRIWTNECVLCSFMNLLTSEHQNDKLFKLLWRQISLVKYSLSEIPQGWKFGLTPLPSLRAKTHNVIQEILPFKLALRLN